MGKLDKKTTEDEVGCIGMKIEKGSRSEYVHKMIEVAQKGFCSNDELSYFLPSMSGSEIIFDLNKDDVSRDLLPDLIKGSHLIELKYREEHRDNNDFGFGSPSKTERLINSLERFNKEKAEKLRHWVATNGGNYYIRSITPSEKQD